MATTKRKLEDPPEQKHIAKSRRTYANSGTAHLETQEIGGLSSDPNIPLGVGPATDDMVVEEQLEEDRVKDRKAPEDINGWSTNHSQRLLLTRENLERLATSTNTKGPKTASSQSLKTGKSDESKSISMTGKGFEHKALQNGVLDSLRSAKHPVKDEAVRHDLDKSRGSASPTQSQYNKFVDHMVEAANEQETITVYSKFVFSDTADLHFDTGYRRGEDKMWTEFPKNVGFNNGLSVPKPDLFEGLSKEAFPPTISAIRTSTLVKDNPRYVALPHMAVEFKAHDKSGHEAKVQAAYDGAAMVYSRYEALVYMGQQDPPRQPAVLTATAIGPQWGVYGHYAHINEATGRIEFYQHRMAGGSMESLNEYKQGRKVLRNMQDFAREQAVDLRDRMQKDFDEHGFRQHSKTVNSAASKPQSAGSVKSVSKSSSRGHLTPKLASSNAPPESAPKGSDHRQSHQSGKSSTRKYHAAVDSGRSCFFTACPTAIDAATWSTTAAKALCDHLWNDRASWNAAVRR